VGHGRQSKGNENVVSLFVGWRADIAACDEVQKLMAEAGLEAELEAEYARRLTNTIMLNPPTQSRETFDYVIMSVFAGAALVCSSNHTAAATGT
jgi:hypothetical protein